MYGSSSFGKNLYGEILNGESLRYSVTFSCSSTPSTNISKITSFFHIFQTQSSPVVSMSLSSIFSVLISNYMQFIVDIGNYRVLGILYKVFPKLNRKNIDFSKKKGIVTGKITRI